MLAKLIKHEFKATARIFLPILGTVLVLTGAAALTVKLGGILVLPGGTGWGGPVLGLASGLLCLLTFIAMMAMMTAAVVVTIQRFYKNLLGDEGYLMFTLPVTPAQHITAKLFDVQNKRFTTITCTRCGYTELYKEMSDGAMDVLDFLIGG